MTQFRHFCAIRRIGLLFLVVGAAIAATVLPASAATSTATTTTTNPAPPAETGPLMTVGSIPSSDTTATVNAYPNGVWSTAALATAHGSRFVAAADSHGCPTGYGCGWADGPFQTEMGIWAQKNNDFSVFNNAWACATYVHAADWNDCISSIDNQKSCTFTWWWDSYQRTNPWVEQPGFAHGDIGSSNDQFSSDSVGC